MTLVNKLREYGLSEKEAIVYISLLKLGSATTTQIAVDSNVSRTTIYDVIKSLRDKGIVSSMMQDKVLHLEAAPPEKLIQLLEERQNAIKEILPNLKSLEAGRPDLPRTELFVSKEGVKTVYQSLIDVNKPLRCFSNTNAMLTLLPYYAPRHIADRVKHKIPLKVLSEDSTIARNVLFSKDKKEYRETRVFNELKDTPMTIYIAENMVALLGTNKDEPLGILIHHKDFAKALEIIFDKVWINSERLGKDK